MKKKMKNQVFLNDYLGCFDNFFIEDSICKKFCVLRLRCAVERDQNTRLEILEELVSATDGTMKIQ
ncbi:MAG: hypothetical protein CL941_08225 [Desulfobacter sp.]|mgnify:CR=1 FL=1|jgi:hypothetical protein|nr:hypothetical protein [Desulfobacter sp.]|tara:strand:+ start:3983 stop:4180 length:198 start_codon:yes stop_codon:yes gene_type:complete